MCVSRSTLVLLLFCCRGVELKVRNLQWREDWKKKKRYTSTCTSWHFNMGSADACPCLHTLPPPSVLIFSPWLAAQKQPAQKQSTREARIKSFRLNITFHRIHLTCSLRCKPEDQCRAFTLWMFWQCTFFLNKVFNRKSRHCFFCFVLFFEVAMTQQICSTSSYEFYCSVPFWMTRYWILAWVLSSKHTSCDLKNFPFLPAEVHQKPTP